MINWTELELATQYISTFCKDSLSVTVPLERVKPPWLAELSLNLISFPFEPLSPLTWAVSLYVLPDVSDLSWLTKE